MSLPAPTLRVTLRLAVLAALLALVPGLGGFAAEGPDGAAVPDGEPGRGMLLVAAERLRDPNFSRTVVLLLDYGEDGALGLVLNRPLRLPLGALVPDLEGPAEAAPRLYLGGPVGLGQVMLLVRAAEPPPESMPVFGRVYASASMTLLERVMEGELSREDARAYVGRAGWAPGQLDREIARGDWHLVQGVEGHVFDAGADDLWERLMRTRRGRWVAVPPQPSPRSAATWKVPAPSSHTRSSMEAQHTGQSS